MIRKLFFLLVIAVAVIAIIAAFKSPDFTITRKAVIDVPPDKVFPLVNDFHKWESWSPWAKKDPNMKQTFEGTSAGKGTIYTWAGNKEVGEGRMTITESQPDELIRIKLEFLKPFAATSDTLFTFQRVGAQTHVTWTMSGKNNFIARAFCLFMNMDDMVGGDFEKGLASMKAVAEAPVK